MKRAFGRFLWASRSAYAAHLFYYGAPQTRKKCPSIARKVYLKPGVGVGQLRKWYGGNNRRGYMTEHFRRANSGIIRSVMIQLEEMKVTEQCEGGGRRMSRVGQQDLDRIAGSVFFDAEEE